MNKTFAKLGLTVASAIVLTSAFSPSAHAWRRYNPVNNAVEARRDINNNGVVGPHDRRVIASHHLYRAAGSGPVVNTPVEARFDHNNNGWVGPRESYAITHRNVNNLRDVVCDSNNNGIIGPGEVRCAY